MRFGSGSPNREALQQAPSTLAARDVIGPFDSFRRRLHLFYVELTGPVGGIYGVDAKSRNPVRQRVERNLYPMRPWFRKLVTESNFSVALAFWFIAELELLRACSSH